MDTPKTSSAVKSHIDNSVLSDQQDSVSDISGQAHGQEGSIVKVRDQTGTVRDKQVPAGSTLNLDTIEKLENSKSTKIEEDSQIGRPGPNLRPRNKTAGAQSKPCEPTDIPKPGQQDTNEAKVGQPCPTLPAPTGMDSSAIATEPEDTPLVPQAGVSKLPMTRPRRSTKRPLRYRRASSDYGNVLSSLAQAVVNLTTQSVSSKHWLYILSIRQFPSFPII